jgi:hypothetical protein
LPRAAATKNSAKDQGLVFANRQRVKSATDTHAALVGHTGKDETKGSRGSNAILGDVDVMVTISGDTIRTATVTKANDSPEGPLFSFKSDIHHFGTDEPGDPITVNVASDERILSQSGKEIARSRWPKGLKLVHEAITGALLARAQITASTAMVLSAGRERSGGPGLSTRNGLSVRATATEKQQSGKHGDGI